MEQRRIEIPYGGKTAMAKELSANFNTITSALNYLSKSQRADHIRLKALREYHGTLKGYNKKERQEEYQRLGFEPVETKNKNKPSPMPSAG
jgi:hypothetical protein